MIIVFLFVFILGLLMVIAGVLILCWKIIWYWIRAVALLIYGVLTYVFHATFMRASLSSGGYLKRRHEAEELDAKLREAEAEQVYRDQLKVEQDRIVFATLQKRRELEAKYPLADRALFDQWMSSFNTKPLVYCDKLVEMIRLQHDQRLEASVVNTYTLTEVLTMDVVEERREGPITVTTYRRGRDLVVLILNKVTEFNTFFVTADPVLAARIASSTINAQLVKSVSAEFNSNTTLSRSDVNEVYSKAVHDVEEFRRGGQSEKPNE